MAIGAVAVEPYFGSVLLFISKFKCKDLNRKDAHLPIKSFHNRLQCLYGSSFGIHGYRGKSLQYYFVKIGLHESVSRNLLQDLMSQTIRKRIIVFGLN